MSCLTLKAPACACCAFWRREARVRPDESQELREYRPCRLGVGDAFVGHRTLDRQPRTSPESTCELFRAEGGAQ